MTIESVDFQEYKPSPDTPGYDPNTAPEVKMAVVSNVWVKLMHFKNPGDYIPGHIHNFDHMSLLSKGSVEVLTEGEVTTFTAPTLIYIRKGSRHQITALTENTVLSCIHALRDDQKSENIIPEDMIPRGSNPTTVVRDFNLARLAQPF